MEIWDRTQRKYEMIVGEDMAMPIKAVHNRDTLVIRINSWTSAAMN